MTVSLRLRRLARRALVGLVAALGVVLVALALMLATRAGRNLALGYALNLVNEAIPGRISAGDFHELTLHSLELRTLEVFDPRGARVLSLETLRVELDLLALRPRDVRVRRVMLTNGFVDASAIDQPRRGLLAAFVDPEAPPSPPSTEPPPYVRVDSIELEGCSLALPRPSQLAPSRVKELRLRASFELDEAPRARVESLSLGVDRDGERVLTLSRLRGLFGRGRERSSVSFAAEVQGAKLEVEASGVLPPASNWKTAPVMARLSLDGVTAGRVARLARDDTLGKAFAGPIDLSLEVGGSVSQLRSTLELRSRAGPLRLSASLRGLRHLDATLEARGVTPGRVVPGAPAEAITGRVVVDADLGRSVLERAPESVALGARVEEASVGGEDLPDLELAGTVSRTEIKDLRLDLSDDASRAQVSGRVGFDSTVDLDVSARIAAATLRRLARLSGQRHELGGGLTAKLHVKGSARDGLAVNGSMRGKGLRYDDISLESIELRVALGGKLPDISGLVESDVENLESGDIAIRSAALALRGGPRTYRTTLRARSNQGDVDLSATLERDGSDLIVEANGKGTRGGHVVNLRVDTTRLSPGGAVETEGVTVAFGGQTVILAGGLNDRASALVLEAADVDLAAFQPLLPEDVAPRGKLSARFELRGALARPALDVHVAGAGVRFGDRPGIDLSADGRFDARRGTSALTVSVTDVLGAPRSTHRLALTLDARSRFSVREPLAAALEAARHQARLELRELDLEFVQSMLPQTMVPASGEIHANLDVQGTLEKPSVALDLEGTLSPEWSSQTVALNHALRLDNKTLETTFTVKDRQGDWVNLSASASLPSLSVMLKRPQQILEEQRWRLSAELSERKLGDLPLPKGASLPPATTVGARLSATHEPGQEPGADFTLVARQTGAPKDSAECSRKPLRLDSKVSLHHGRLTAELVAEQMPRELLRLRANAEIGLAAALVGAKPEFGAITVRAWSRALDLGTLPFLCRRLAGRLDMDASVSDPLGSRPKVDVTVRALNLSAGSRTTVNANLDLVVRSKRAELRAEVRHGINVSTISAELPVEVGGGRLAVDGAAPIRGAVDLRHLPIDPFLDPKGAISYATGTLSGHVELGGTLKGPHVDGAVELEGLGFTATDMAQPVRDVGGRIEFSEKHVRLAGLVAKDKDGELRLNGDVDFANLRRIQGEFMLSARDFPLRQQGQVVATTDVDAHLRTTVTPQKTRVFVTLEQVDTWLENSELRQGMDLAEHADVIVDGVPARPRERAESRPARAAARPGSSEAAGAQAMSQARKPAPPARITEIVLDARDKFWVKRSDFAVKLAARLTARIEGEQVEVKGKLDLDRGYLQLFGKVFEIQRGGYLEFIGSPQPDPVLKIEAVHENRRSGEKVQVRIVGRGSAPVLAFLVDEREVTAGDAFVALFGAQRSNQDPSAADSQAKNFVGGLTAGVLATAARRQLGAAAPVIMIEPGSDTEESRLRAGFELDSIVPEFLRDVITGVYFEGIVANQQDSETQDANVHGGALLEVYFPEDFFAAGQYGPGSTWSLDVGWQL